MASVPLAADPARELGDEAGSAGDEKKTVQVKHDARARPHAHGTADDDGQSSARRADGRESLRCASNNVSGRSWDRGGREIRSADLRSLIKQCLEE